MGNMPDLTVQKKTKITRETLERMYWDEKKSLSKIAHEIGCSNAWIFRLMAKFGIPRRTRSQALRGLIRKDYWTQEEIKILQENYLNKRTSEIAKILGRSRSAIEHKASKLKIRKLHFWTREEVIKGLQELFKIHGYLNKEIAGKKRGLVDACRGHFGGFNKTLIAAGLPINYGDFPIPDLTPEFAYLLGLVVGDGCVSKGYVILGVTKKDGELIESFSRICKQLFGRGTSIGEKDERWFKSPCGKVYKSKPMLCASLGSIAVSSWITKNFKPSGKWIIPQLILDSPPEIQASLLKGFFDADGSVSRAVIRLSQKDEEILNQVQKILMDFSIESRIRFGKKEFCLEISDLSNIEKFRNSIGFGLARKQEKLIEYTKRVKRFKESIIFREVGESERMILEILKEKPLRLREIASRINLDKANTHVHLEMLQMGEKIRKFKLHRKLAFWGLPEHKLELSPEEIKDLAAGKHKWSKEKIIKELKRLVEINGFVPPVDKVPSSLRGACERYFGGWNKAKDAAGIINPHQKSYQFQ
jgi:intein/homing endonuclease